MRSTTTPLVAVCVNSTGSVEGSGPAGYAPARCAGCRLGSARPSRPLLADSNLNAPTDRGVRKVMPDFRPKSLDCLSASAGSRDVKAARGRRRVSGFLGELVPECDDEILSDASDEGFAKDHRVGYSDSTTASGESGRDSEDSVGVISDYSDGTMDCGGDFAGENGSERQRAHHELSCGLQKTPAKTQNRY